MKNIQLFLDVFVLVLLVLIHLYRHGENLWCHDVSHTWIYSWCKIKVVFFNFFIFIFARFGFFAGFGGFVSALSFRCFGF